MRRLVVQDSWPDSWKYSYSYDLQEVYGHPQRRGYSYAYDARRVVTLGMITEVVPAGARILDVAAGQGNFTLALAELGYDVTWNDLRADLAGYVQLKHERGLVGYAPGNLFELRFESLFDCVVVAEVIEHVAHPDRLLGQVARLVAPGGYVVVTTPNGRYFRNRLPKFSACADPAVYEHRQFKPDADGHIFLLDPRELEELAASAGLRLDRRCLLTNPLTQGHLKSERLLRILPQRLVYALEAATRRLPERLSERCHFQMAVRFRRPALSTARSEGRPLRAYPTGLLYERCAPSTQVNIGLGRYMRLATRIL